MNDVTADLTKRMLGEVAFNLFKAGWNARMEREREEQQWEKRRKY